MSIEMSSKCTDPGSSTRQYRPWQYKSTGNTIFTLRSIPLAISMYDRTGKTDDCSLDPFKFPIKYST